MRLSLIPLLVLAGCGGRSGLGLPSGVPPVADGISPARDASVDGPLLRPDAPRWPDQRVAPDWWSCLPIPATQVEGYYEGAWKGVWKCPGQPGASLGGTLSFKLYAGSPDSFAVAGDMSGTVSPGLPFGTMISGTMGCTALSADLPEIIVGSGAVLTKLTGALVGTFQTSPQGFPSGQWKAAEPGGKCQASGSWTAYRK